MAIMDNKLLFLLFLVVVCERSEGWGVHSGYKRLVHNDMPLTQSLSICLVYDCDKFN